MKKIICFFYLIPCLALSQTVQFKSSNVLITGGSISGVTVRGTLMSVGGAVDPSQGITVNPTLTGANQFGINVNNTGDGTDTTKLIGIVSTPATAATSYTVPELISFLAQGGIKGSGSTVTNSVGFASRDQTVGTVNVGFSSEVTAGGNKYGFRNVGNANNDLGTAQTKVGYLSTGASSLTLTTSSIGLSKMTASGSAPGAGGGKIELVCGTNAGSAKLIIYAGTSATAVTIVDNIGSGVTGC